MTRLPGPGFVTVSGEAGPGGTAASDLPAVARLLHREIRDHGDDIRGG
jgi:hypothetical protein